MLIYSKCRACIIFGDDYGDNEATFHCKLERGHEGPHEEKGDRGNRKHPLPYALTWRTQSLISRRLDVQFGAYCLRGTRIPVRAIKASIKGGDSPEFIAKSYGITLEQVMACLAFREKGDDGKH